MKKILVIGGLLIGALFLLESIARSAANALQAQAIIESNKTAATAVMGQVMLSLALAAVIFAIVGAIGAIVFLRVRAGQKRGNWGHVENHGPRLAKPRSNVTVFRPGNQMISLSPTNRVQGSSQILIIRGDQVPSQDEDSAEDQIFRDWGW